LCLVCANMEQQSAVADRQTLPAILALQARSEPHRTFLIDRGVAITYAAVDAESRRIAGALNGLGVKSGDRVAIWLPNTTAWLASFFACVRLGAIAVALNTRFRTSEISDVLKRSGAKVLIFCPRFGEVDLQEILAEVNPASLIALETVVVYSESQTSPLPNVLSTKHVYEYKDLAQATALDGEAGKPEDGCILFTTSGTTRGPKFVMHSQSALIHHAHAVASHFGLQAGKSTILLSLPFAGIFGFCQVTAALAAGATMVTAPIFSAEESMRSIQSCHVTHMVAADVTVDRLLAAATGAHPFAGVQFCVYAAFAPSLEDIASRAAARGLTLVGVYGSSEVQALFARQLETASLKERVEKGGWPVSADAHVRARDVETGRVLPHGEPGELEIKAPSLMIGYFGDPQASSNAITDDGYFRTSDLGYTCPNGRFVYLTRLDDSLRLGGFLVSPAEIEAVILEYAGVEECQVVGVKAGGEWHAFAFVIAKPGHSLNEPEIIRHCGRRLSKSKVPVRVHQIDKFPTTESANSTKIQKGKLRLLAQNVLEQSG
jgi:fatty-acyl-CoA synthase